MPTDIALGEQQNLDNDNVMDNEIGQAKDADFSGQPEYAFQIFKRPKAFSIFERPQKEERNFT